jgi:predicted small secreted protein
MEIFMKTILTIALTMVALSGLAACNTTAGMGKDIKAAGEGINNSATKHKNY